MQRILLGRSTLIWAILSGATAVSWAMGHDAAALSAHYAGAVIILVAFIKVRFVLLEFMELRHAPLPMRIAAEFWGVILCTVLVMLYLRAWPAHG